MGRKKFEKRTIPKPNDKPELSSSDDDDLEQLAQQVVKQTQSPAVSDNEVLAFSSDEESINDFGDIDNWNEDQGRNTFHIRRTGEFDRAPAIDDESGFKELEENEAVVRRQRMIEAIDKEADDDLINQLREMAIPSQQIAEPTQTHVELDALADEIDGKRNMLEKVLGPFLKLVAEDNDLGDEMKKFVDNCRQLYSF